MKKKWLLFVVAGICIAAVARKCASMCSSQTEQSSEPEKATKWDKMCARIEQMPDEFPSRVTSDDVQTAHDDTERTLETLEAGDVPAPEAEALTGVLL